MLHFIDLKCVVIIVVVLSLFYLHFISYVLCFQVTPQQQMKNNRSKADTSVVLTILDAAPLTLSVPAELDVGDPAFIQFVAQEALALHKRRIRGTDPGGAVV